MDNDSHAISVIERGTPEFHRTNLALFAAGFSTFALMYCVQPLLPLFSRTFQVSAAASSLAISATTGALAITIPLAGSVSEALGRKPVMVISLFASAGFTIVSACVPGWHTFLLARALEGVAFSGLPAVAMAYLSEEMHRKSVGLAMGLYIGGTALGGMLGRFTVAILTDWISWRFALAVAGTAGLVAAWIFWRSLPPSRHFHPQPMAFDALLCAFGEHLHEAGLFWLFLEGFLLMGTFVTVYNYAGYRLIEPPFSLSQTAVGAIFVVYLVGVFSSAWVGDLAGRRGRGKVFWIVVLIMLAGLGVSLWKTLTAMIAGITLVTFGFFGGHSILSSWVGLRARRSKGTASSLYMLFYYLGSSIAGTVGGVFWKMAAWNGVIGFLSCLLLVSLATGIRLVALRPLPAPMPAELAPETLTPP